MITDLLKSVVDRGRRGRAARRPSDPPPIDRDALQVEYAPRRDGRPDPGEVVWTWVPYEDDPSQGKDRPVLVIGRLGEALAGIALTTKASGDARDRVAVGSGGWDPAGRPSFARIDRVLAIDPAKVRREGSTFDRARFDALVGAVRARNTELRWVAEPSDRGSEGR